MNEELYTKFHQKVEELTGDPWCPYPSERFMLAILEAQEYIALKLINHRRTLLFPNFLNGEPQQEDIDTILGNLTKA